MQSFWDMVTRKTRGEAAPLEHASEAADEVGRAVGIEIYPRSVTAENGAGFAMGRRDVEKRLVVFWPEGETPAVAGHLSGDTVAKDLSVGKVVIVDGPTDATNAAAVRAALAWTGPQLVGDRPSIGMGDRLGLATPGHVAAVRDTEYCPMLAQQSIREMTRTDRTARQVMDDATWGVLQTGYRDGFGSDADHLKSPEDVDLCKAAGFTFYTVDPGEHVVDAADEMGESDLADAFTSADWDALETTAEETLDRYVGETISLTDEVEVAFSEADLHRAVVKYGGAVAHAARMYRHLAKVFGDEAFELEISVDETEAPTTPAEHYYVAQELHRMGVEWISLAPRFVGRFEKGVDYLGDLGELERTFDAHVEIAKRFGDYKISLHSGSDKFSVYEMAAKHGPRRVHVKTAGTSYLEALRVLARLEPELFRDILAFSRDRYETDKATYHVSADLGKVPGPEELSDAELPTLLDDFHARQVLHVTFGSVLTAEDGATFRGPLLAALERHEEAYEAGLEKHFRRHLGPFLK